MEAKSINLEDLRAEYKRNEAINAHTENCLLLVNNFGTDSQISRMEEIAAKYKRLGYLPNDLIIERDNMVRPLYAILRNVKSTYAIITNN